MFTRRDIMNAKPGSADGAGRIFEGEALPLPRRQKGARHADTCISPELSEAVPNSHRDTQEHAESYGRAAYPAALKAPAGGLEGTPQVETFGTSSWTFRLLSARPRAAYRASELGRGGRPSLSLAHHPKLGLAHTATGSCRVNERRVGAVTILDLDGELRTQESRDALRDAVERLSGEGRNQILLNLTRLTGVDAGGLGELLQSGVKLNEGGGQLKLLRPARSLRKMMSIACLLNVFDIYESESEAVAGFANPLLDSQGQLLSYEYARYETHP